MNTAPGQDEEEEEEEEEGEEEVADVAAVVRQVHVQCHRLQGLVRKRWLDDALKLRNGGLQEDLSHDGMKEAASKWVVEAANAAGDEWASDDLSAWTFQYHAKD